jgi:hypothetical protein
MTIDKSIIKFSCFCALNRFKRERCHEPLAKFPDLAWKIRADVVNRIWNRTLESMGAFTFKQPAVNAEAAVAACIQAGLDKFHIDYTTNVYVLKMENLHYRVVRELSGFRAYPLPPGQFPFVNTQSLSLSKEEFADFLFTFDGLVPEIKAALVPILEKARAILVENEKELMIKRIREVTKKAATEQP